MNDIETLRAMLDRAKIEYTQERGFLAGNTIIIVERGYCGFVTIFTFIDGALLDMRAEE